MTIAMAVIVGLLSGVLLHMVGGRLAERRRYREERAIVARATDAWLSGDERKVA